jgi:hypothetical protein
MTTNPTPPSPTDPGTPAPDPPLPEPEVQPSSTPDGPQTIPSPSTPEGEPGPDPDQVSEAEIRASNPNAASVQGTVGDLGVSSERIPHDTESIEGTGSRGSATHSADGTWPTLVDEGTQEWTKDQPAANVDPVPGGDPQLSSGTEWEGIDRTVGEERPAEVPSHRSDPARNPGHSHS